MKVPLISQIIIFALIAAFQNASSLLMAEFDVCSERKKADNYIGKINFGYRNWTRAREILKTESVQPMTSLPN